jgi:hypothetical protein
MQTSEKTRLLTHPLQFTVHSLQALGSLGSVPVTPCEWDWATFRPLMFAFLWSVFKTRYGATPLSNKLASASASDEHPEKHNLDM